MEITENHRFGEDENTFRPKSARVFRVNNLWYFYTREEGVIGPYPNRMTAEYGVSSYLQDLLDKNMIHAA